MASSDPKDKKTPVAPPPPPRDTSNDRLLSAQEMAYIMNTDK